MTDKKNGNKLTRSQLSNVATELNEVLEPDPLINAKAKKDELESKLKEAGGLIDPEEDELTESTWSILEKIGAAHRPAQEYVPQRGEKAVEEGTPDQDREEQAEGLQEGNVADTPISEESAEAKQEPEIENKKGSENKSGKKSEKPEQQKASSDEGKKTKIQERIEFLTPLIQEGKHTKKELVQKLQEQFDMSASAAQTLLTDAKNPKYSKFHTTVIQDENKIMSFKE